MLGITLGVWALITVLSVMNGFERELRERILGVASHVTVRSSGDWMPDWQALDSLVLAHRQVTGRAPYIFAQGMLTKGREVAGTLIRGVLPVEEIQVSEIANNMTDGQLTHLRPGEFGMVIGGELARQLRVSLGDKVTLVAPKGQMTPAGLLPRLKRFTVVGIFNIGMYEYDAGLVLIHLDDASRLYRSNGQVSGVRLKLQDVYDAPLVHRDLERELGPGYFVSDWTREHANFFRALKIEKRVMFIILFLIVAVAAFNIVATLVMVVTDKQSDIAILRTLGMSPQGIMGVFMVQGVVIGVIGTILGGITGIVTSLNIETLVPFFENLFAVKFFPADVYVISDFPAELHWDDVIKITGASLIMSAVATLYPAWRGSRTQPAEALRYE